MIFVTNDDVMGKNIRFLRQRQGLYPEKFAEIVGMDPDDLFAIEEGLLMDIDAQVLLNISNFFHMETQCIVEKNLKVRKGIVILYC